MRTSMAAPSILLVPMVSLASLAFAGTQFSTVLRPAPWFVQGAQTGAAFGQSTAPAGDIDGDGYGDLLVGAPLHDGPAGVDAGAAFLYRGSANGFLPTPTWTYDGPQSGAQTGSVVAPAGDVNGDGYLDVLVTTPQYDTSGPVIVDAGRFDLFYGSEDGPSASPDVTILGQQAGGRVGFAAAGAGDVNGDGYADVIVGMPNVFSFFVNDGVARIYHGHFTGLLSTSFSPIGGAANEQLGYAVAGVGDIDGDGYDDVAVGAPGTTTFDPSDGSVYLHRGSSGGVSNAAFAVQHGFTDSCRFGAAVAGAGDVDGDGYADIVIGAPGAVNGGGRPGWAAIVRGAPAGFGLTFWSSFGTNDGERFGVAVATAGDLNGDDRADAVIGADRWPTPGDRRGRAIVVLGGATGATLDSQFQGDANGQALGVSVATAGDADNDGMSDLAIGVPGANAAETGGGRIELWRGGASKPVEAPGWPVAEAEASAAFGLAVAGGIDARRVGVDDFFASAPYANAGFTDAGALRTAPSNWPAPVLSPGNVATGTQSLATLGNELARAGDVNGDGYEDLISGSKRYSAGAFDRGIAQLFLGGPAGLGSSAAWSFVGPAANFNAGHDVDAGDFNGDGYTDLLVGSWTAGETEVDGSARAFLGSPGGPELVASWVSPPVTGDTWYGFRVAVGDWDADGYDDVAVGAPNASRPELHEGMVDVFFGGPNGLSATPAWRLERDIANGTFGYGLGDAGDVNGDGVSDLIVGATGVEVGRAYVYLGNRARAQPSRARSRTFAPDISASSFGWSVAGVGDIDKDGFGDFVVGAPLHFGGQSNEGIVFLYRGSVGGGEVLPWWKVESNVTEAFFGNAITRAGDVNQDGWPDFAVGAPFHPPGGTVHLFLGGGGSPLHSTLQTVPAVGTVPVSMGGRLPGDTVAPLVSFRSAAGRTKGRIEIQLGTQNEAWGAGTRTLHGPYDSGPPGLFGSLFPVQIVKPFLANAVGWRWRERSVTMSPYFPHSPWRQPRSFETAQVHFRTGGTNVAVDPRPTPDVPALALVGLHPSPARSECRIAFRLARASALRFEVTDVRGRAVRRIPLGERPAGEGGFVFDGRDDAGAPLPAGVYLATLETSGARVSRKFVRLP